MEKESFHFNCLILLLIVVASRSLALTRPCCHEDEKSALLEFKAAFFTKDEKPPCCSSATSDEPAKIESWNASTGESKSDCCSWAGVQCDKVSGHVIDLNLSCSCLSGKINSTTSIFRLLHLRSLNLAFNYFNCEIPPAIENLGSLRDLNFSNSGFMGHIPHSLGHLTRLIHLDLSNNRLIGTTLNDLTLLPETTSTCAPRHIDPNIFDPCQDPHVNKFGGLNHPKRLDRHFNSITGEVPSFLGNLVQLKSLSLLSGKIPSSLGKLIQLTNVDLSFNQFHGAIPSMIFQLQDLQRLNLNSNNLSGTVKLDWFSEVESLQVLGLSSNKLSLIVETTISNDYYALGLGSCNLNGFPEFLQYQTHLFFLDLSYNNISGHVPEWFLTVSTKYLRHLNLSGNFLTSFAQDPIIFKWEELVVADLRFNELQGSIPIPPSNMCNLSSTLEVMSLQSNNFIGKIPYLNGNSCALIMIDLSCNKLHGPLPRSLCNCDNLEFLNFGNNQIMDVFPSWLGSLRNLKVLILRYNRFHGHIGEAADGIDFLALQIIDLSQNIFSGSLPSGYFKHWTAMKVSETNSSSYIGDAIKRAWIFSSDATFHYSMRVIAKGIQMNYSKIQEYLTLIDLSSNNFSGAIPKASEA
ncbi:hypothetical protein BT93_H1228 [Corymbia citriodora subsp. variegata]|nr:hypothetical protein BT93_H1228 [Corymbia citriodora subsp. variegata]